MNQQHFSETADVAGAINRLTENHESLRQLIIGSDFQDRLMTACRQNDKISEYVRKAASCTALPGLIQEILIGEEFEDFAQVCPKDRQVFYDVAVFLAQMVYTRLRAEQISQS